MIELHSKEDLEIILSDVTKNGDIFELGLMNETYIPIYININKKKNKKNKKQAKQTYNSIR